MSPEEFRRLALALPGAVEGGHGGHPDFRIAGKIFAALGYPDARSAMAKLPRERQQILVKAESGTFSPAKGLWGERGSTIINLERLDESTARDLLQAAWSHVGKR